MQLILAAIVELILGIGLLAIGRWGHSNAGSLAPSLLDRDERGAREAVYRRGSVACLAAGILLTATALITFVQAVR